MGNENSKTWLFENVLFLDPNAPPFISKEEYERRKNAAQGYDAEQDQQGDSGRLRGMRVVQRTVPAETHLRTRIFRVHVDIEGRTAEFDLQCINDPLAFVLRDRHGRELQRLPAEYVKQIIRYKNSAKCTFRTPGRKKGETKDIVLTFRFNDSNDTQAFVDTVKLLYGIFVNEYGITRPDVDTEAEKKPRKAPRCQVHGNVPCRCKARGVRGLEQERLIEQQSQDFPVAIAGKLETGSILRWSDVSKMGQDYPSKVVEWHISLVPGNDPEFAELTDDRSKHYIRIENQLAVTEDMVGKKIRLKVTRRIKDPSKKLPVVDSYATSNPISINDAEAKRILGIVTEPTIKIMVQMSFEQACFLYPQNEPDLIVLSRRAPFIQGILTITREGISLGLSDVKGIDSLELVWETFYVTRLLPEESDLGHEEELYLQIHFHLPQQTHETVLRIATPSLWERDAIYHAIYFFKLQKSFKKFDRWKRDLEEGNFAVFKDRYTALWKATSFFEDVTKIKQLDYAQSSQLSYYNQQQDFNEVDYLHANEGDVDQRHHVDQDEEDDSDY